MIKLWRLLNSRKFAIYVLTVMVVLLILSTFLPNHYTLNEIEWYNLENERPQYFWVASHFSTPFLVTNPLFLVVSLFLFLSTFVCTVSRVNKWYKLRVYEFSTDKAFSFSRREKSTFDMNKMERKIVGILSNGRWERSVERNDDSVVIAGQKGTTAFWGSLVFHIGLIVCFFAGPVSVYTTFRGELVMPENVDLPLREGFASHVGKDISSLPDVRVMIHDVKAEFFKGIFEYDFTGILTVRDALRRESYPFAVNRPVNYRGYQFSLHEYGFSPRIVIEKEGEKIFDYYLNLRHPEEGDQFEIVDEGLTALVMFFPDFFREGDRIGSKSRLPSNPVVMVKLYRNDTEIAKGLLNPGDEQNFEQYRLAFIDYKQWVNLVVVRESGITVVLIGFLIGVVGLFVRFLSNERRLEFNVTPREEGTALTVKGYSRYYPAFLEREVVKMAKILKETNDGIL
jgi:cytochrome c biogenesis protein